MTFFPKSPLIAGIEITPTSTKIALLKKKGKKWVIEKVEEVPLSTKITEKHIKESYLVTALPSREILTRPLELPLKKEKDIEEALPFQAEPLLPYPLEKGVLQKITCKSHAEGSLLTLLAAKKEHCERHICSLKERGIDPDALTSAGVALAALATSEDLQLWIHLGQTEGTIALIEERKLVAARAVENAPLEIQKSVLALLAPYKQKNIESITLVSDDPETFKMVEEATQKRVVKPDEEIPQKFALAIGLALAATKKELPNFRAKESSLLFKRVKKPLIAYFALIFLLFVSLSALTKKNLAEREKALLSRSCALFPEGCASVGDLASKLEKRSEAIGKIPDTFPLYPQLPKVRDLLAWFSHEGKFEGHSIEEMHYTMICRPHFEKRGEKYRVKVEMVLHCPSSSEANRLHEALLISPFLDRSQPVEWIPVKGKYKTTFFLKDKTRYS